jgi:hypothetical protein
MVTHAHVSILYYDYPDILGCWENVKGYPETENESKFFWILQNTVQWKLVDLLTINLAFYLFLVSW